MPVTCELDREVLNEDTVSSMNDLGLSVFAKLCGFNRGAFVLDPPDGKTYGCTTFPEVFSTNAGISDPNATVPDSASLTQYFSGGNITESQTVEIVDAYVKAVYSTSGDGNMNAYGCEVNGLAKLSGCESATEKQPSLLSDGDTVRAVTLAGAFVPALWATGGRELTMDEVKQFYTSGDFEEMKKLGVNTVQIPVPHDSLAGEGHVSDTLSHLIEKTSKAGLNAIIVLVKPKQEDTADSHGGITGAAEFAEAYSSVIAIQLPAAEPSMLTAVRHVATNLPVLVPTNKGQLKTLSFPSDKYLFAALDVGAKTSVADIASSDSLSDRMKMFYHESTTCIDRSPIEWLECYQDMPVYVSSGFDLAIDDCIHQDEGSFKDYGQCDRFDETLESGWWERHRLSMASRQMFAYSKGLGWSFSAWKLFGEDGGGITSPANLLCLRDVAAAGLIPDLESNSEELGVACLNGPDADFIMGDETYAPTPLPVDCGYGWWNETIQNCTYWIPPAPTEAPTEQPTMPCPSCGEMGTSSISAAAAGGAIIALILNYMYQQKFGPRSEGYQTLP